VHVRLLGIRVVAVAARRAHSGVESSRVPVIPSGVANLVIDLVTLGGVDDGVTDELVDVKDQLVESVAA
jgi:hypothetical protein